VTRWVPSSFSRGALPGIHRALTGQEADQFDKYLKLLTKWQKSQRLVGSVDPAWVVENLFIDSLCFLDALPPGVARVADVGSGAGIPGIPMAITRRDLWVDLIEARQRRVSFLSTVVRELALDNVSVIAARVEELLDPPAQGYDAVVMRCTAKLDLVLDEALRLARSGGVVVVAAKSSAVQHGHGELLRVESPTNSPRAFLRFQKPLF
jgi:16S rRNA (guanine527-N7)-methyltransferase